LISLLVLVIGVGGLDHPEAWAEASAPGRCSPWRVAPVPPDPDATFTSQLLGVSGTSFRDVWAVGQYLGAPSAPLIVHWDGTAWSFVEAPSGTDERPLYGVAAVSPTDAWAVGWIDNFVSNHSLAMHWDGQSWSVVSTPKAPSDRLFGVGALSSSDVWAVGYWSDQYGVYPLTMHWDGAGWTHVPAPGVAVLYGVAGIEPDDVWAVGYRSDNIFGSIPVTLHWDGSAWAEVPAPDPPGDVAFAESVSGVASDDVWMVGLFQGGSHNSQPFVQHWDGIRWRPVRTPFIPGGNSLLGVSAAGPDDVWAVGWQDSTGSKVLTEHWDGSRWRVVPAPAPGDQTGLFAVDAISPANVWAVGSHLESESDLFSVHSRGCSIESSPRRPSA